MGEDGPNRIYYVISDLHIGGDEQLGEVEFLDEFLDFLKQLEQTDENAELVINGDAFGLWEITTVEGIEKFDVLTKHHPEVFEQLAATGENVTVTIIPGNHDHELAAYDGYVERFAEYNVEIVKEESITRPVGDRTIHFEHGHQHDPNNRITRWGDPLSTPLGYYLNTRVTSIAGQLSDRGRFDWLKDLQAVTPTERLPVWLYSKYFYREMNPALRYGLVPFMFLFNISAVLAILAGLHLTAIWSTPFELVTGYLGQLGTVGTVAWFLLAINVTIAGLFMLLAVPLYFIRRDIRQTIARFGVLKTDLTVDLVAPYVKAARETFAERPETAIYCHGHTHRPSALAVGERLVVNSGTWVKRLHRRDGVIGILPPVFYPTYQLAVVRIAQENEQVVVDFQEFEKPSPAPEELSLTERLLTLGRKPDPGLPDRIVLPSVPAGSPVEAGESSSR